MGRGLAPQIDKVRPDGVMVHDWGRGETPRGVIHPPTKRQRRVSSRLNQVAAGVCETPARAGVDRASRGSRPISTGNARTRGGGPANEGESQEGE